MTVGERIKQRRQELGYSQEELAKKMGYSGKSSVCKAETFGDNITTAKISKFAKALDCTESYLMGWSSEYDNAPASELLRIENEQLERYKAETLEPFNDTEKKCIELFGELNNEQQELILNMMKNMKRG